MHELADRGATLYVFSVRSFHSAYVDGKKDLRDSWVYSEVSSFLKAGVCDMDFGQRQGGVRCLKIFRSVLVY